MLNLLVSVLWLGEGKRLGGGGGVGTFYDTHKLYNFCLTMLATFWSVSLNLWWCYFKHFDYLNVLRCQKTKEGRKILLSKICCCQGDCNVKQGFCNMQNPHAVSISQEFTILKRECFKIDPVLNPLTCSSS